MESSAVVVLISEDFEDVAIALDKVLDLRCPSILKDDNFKSYVYCNRLNIYIYIY